MKYVFKKLDGVFVVWCYINFEVNVVVDEVFWWFYKEKFGLYWDKVRWFVEDGYKGIEFLFEKIMDELMES